MFSATTYTIRQATADDAALRSLTEIGSHAPVSAGPVLVGVIGGKPQAALSLTDGRMIANSLVPTQLLAHLRIRAGALGAYKRTPSLPTRMRAALSGAVLSRPIASSS